MNIPAIPPGPPKRNNSTFTLPGDQLIVSLPRALPNEPQVFLQLWGRLHLFLPLQMQTADASPQEKLLLLLPPPPDCPKCAQGCSFQGAGNKCSLSWEWG